MALPQALPQLQAFVDRIAAIIDLPTEEQLDAVLLDAGWLPAARGRWNGFTACGCDVSVRVGHGQASIDITLADFGSRDDFAYDDYEDVEAYDQALDQRYTDAEALVATVADALQLPPADPLAVDALRDHGDRIILRAGHWAVAFAAVQHDTDLPVTAGVDISYGADLPGRLTALVPPPAHVLPVAGLDGLPADYRWLMERYGPGTFDDYLTLRAPEELGPPIAGPLVGLLRYQTPAMLPVATTSDGAVVSWVLGYEDRPDEWWVQVARPGGTPTDLHVGLLQFLVVTLSGALRLPAFSAAFPNAARRFSPPADPPLIMRFAAMTRRRTCS